MRFFNRIILQTPESVELEFTLAGIGNRTLALLIDYVIWGIALLVLVVGWGIVSSGLFFSLGARDKVQLWLAAVSLLIFFAVYVGYFVFFETLWRGQTPGKRYVKIRVIREDGKPGGLSQAVLRSLLRPIDDFFLIGALLIVLGKREKRIGDWAAGTLVVQEERPVVTATFALSEEAKSLATQLLEEIDISQLLPDDFAVIREYLQRRSQMTTGAKAELSLQLARQVREILGLEQLPFKMTPDLFLEAIYLAYQQQPS